MFSVRGIKFKYFIAVFSAVIFIFGVYITFFQSRGFIQTQGSIIDVEEDTTGDDPTYWATVEYSVDGVTYTDRAQEAVGADSLGKTVTILYNPDNPAEFHIKSWMSIYAMVVGGVLLLIVIVSSIIGGKDKKEIKKLQEEGGYTGYAPSVKGDERELYFLTDLGTAKYGHRIEDGNRKVLYEAKMSKFSLANAYKFDFIDHEHGTTTSHLVGHEEESQWSSIILDNHSTFEFDGVDVWKHLKENGISVDTSYTAGDATIVGMKYVISRDGVEIARAEQTSQYPHEDDAADHKLAAAIPVDGFYRLWTKEQNLDLLFVTLLAFARSKAADDKGGSNGAILGTLKNLQGK
ncbi:MAG: DUF3592 domain-containing protein [Butyrivibrio sp.]|nr:DUF3592 domain-containing protein [Butyrivibrio sp.]